MFTEEGHHDQLGLQDVLRAGCRRLQVRVRPHCQVSQVVLRPVLVTFEEFKDRDEVLRKAGLLKGGNIHVTEDMSRRVRESRQELRRFMRDVRRANPASVCNLQYDSLYVDKKCFKYNPVEGRVVEHSAGAVSTQTGPSPTVCLSDCLSRTPRLRTETDESQHWAGPRLTTWAPGWAWPALPRGRLASTGEHTSLTCQPIVVRRTQSCLIGGLGEDHNELVAEMDEKIRELKSVVTDKDTELEKLKETLRLLEEKLENNDGIDKNDVQTNGTVNVNGQQEVLEEVDDIN